MIRHVTLPKPSVILGPWLLLGLAASGCSKPASDGAEAKSAPAKTAEAKTAEAKSAEATEAPRPLATPPAAAATTSRTLTFTNQCSFDVWVQSTGSNAGNIPCSPDPTSARANCPTGFLCYEANANTQYCVPGTTQVTQFPVTSPSQVTLDATQCRSGQLVTNPSSDQWGQCTCSGNSGCADDQVCSPIGGGSSQCFWGFELPNGGHLTPPSGGASTGTITIESSTTANAIVASGNFAAQLSCDQNGNCLSSTSTGAPLTRIEYTLATDEDFYDVSYINGVSVPAVMTPVPSTTLAYDAGDPYGCMAAGGDAQTLQAIATFQQQNDISGNTQLQAFACSNDYDEVFVDQQQGLSFVSEPASPTNCTTATDCTDGTVCGLTLDAVSGEGSPALGQLTCGQRLGYWSYTQLCAVNSSFTSPALGVNCSNAQTLAYAECTNQAGVSDQGPGRSCFNSNTTTSGDTCCGFEAWSFGGKPQPLAVGQSAVSGVDTTFWTTNILPVVKAMKAGCPLAYSFQFDDPYSTFTCTTQGTPNAASYAVTLCPNGDAAGVSPPPPPTCTASVPTGIDPDEFAIGVPTGISISIAACDDTGTTCTTPVPPNGGSGTVFTTTSATRYQITASTSSEQQVCQFTIPASGCITRAGSSSQPPCNTWTIDTSGVWEGRHISVTNFSTVQERPTARSLRR